MPRLPCVSCAPGAALHRTAKYLTEAEIRHSVFHVRNEAPPSADLRVCYILEGQRYPNFVLTQRRNAVTQCIAVKEHNAARRNLDRARDHGHALFARVQLVIEPR